jgi:hypothetical protein
VIGTDRWSSKPPCVRKGVPHGQTGSGGIVLAVIWWSPCAQRRCYPTGRCAYRPSVNSWMLIKTSLLSLSFASPSARASARTLISLLHMGILVHIVHGCMNKCVLSGSIDISQIHPHLSPSPPFPPSQAPSSSLSHILSTLHLPLTPTRRQEKEEADIRQTVTKGVPPLAL